MTGYPLSAEYSFLPPVEGTTSLLSRTSFMKRSTKLDRLTAITTYQVSNGEHELIIRLKDQLCHDSMSGEAFETTVIVSLDGKEYRGCGRHLN